MSAIVAIEREEEIEVNSDDNIMFATNLHSLKLRKLFKLKGFLSVVDSRVLFSGKVCLRFNFKFYSLNVDKSSTA